MDVNAHGQYHRPSIATAWITRLTPVFFQVGAWDNATWVNHDMANGGITQLSPGNGVCFLVPDNEAPYFGLTNPKPAPAEVWCGVVSWFIFTRGSFI